jgi:MAF protein
MRKIYLASQSKARRKLLKVFGFSFKVLPSQVHEERHAKGSSYAQLVKANALAKARDVAKRIKDGIVIAADTVSVQDGKIFGKPKNLSQAHAMLKRFSQKPQWVYTGLAVVDKDKNKTIIAHEKTKIFMDSLSDQEIRGYFKKVSPLDKAGSFDIQGKGALFIKKIDGCFYNVVGLPLRKLYRILKRLDIKLFLSCVLCIVACVLTGCSTEYNIVTGKEETYYYSAEREVKIGKSIAEELEKQYKLAQDPLLENRVQLIGKKIAAVADRKDIDYRFKVLDDEEVNAVSLPGGFVYINKGLIDKVANDDELAAVLAHEVGHIVARHSIKKLQAIMGYSFLRLLTMPIPKGGEIGVAADAAFTELILGYSREDELLADQLAARYAKLAGYKPEAMISFLQTLQEVNRRKPLQPRSYFKTHPYVPDRIRVVKQELGDSIDFSDYINIEQEKK